MQLNREENARAIFDAPRELTPPMRREIVAAILFDSLTQPFAGTRGAADARQVLAHAEEFDLHLKICRNPSQHLIFGQVFARNETQFLNGVRLRLWLNGAPFETTWSDNFGQFQFEEVPEGAFCIHVDVSHLTIVSGITIGKQA
jgi:hypothetical protein